MSTPHTEFDPGELDSAYPPGIEKHFWTVARGKIIAAELRALPSHGGRIMEIGCGRGIVVGDLRSRGFDCHGVELAPTPVAESLAPFVSTGMDARDVSESVRLAVRTILLLDVIEHLPDPVEFLSGILASYPGAEHLLITVPARKELWSNYDEFFRHFRRYDTQMLDGTFRKAGCLPARIGYAFHLLYPAMRLAKTRGRTTQLKAPTGLAAALHAVLAQALFLEYLIVPRSIYGTSVLGMATIERTGARG